LVLAGESVSVNGALLPLSLGTISVDITGLAYSGKGTWLGGSGNWLDTVRWERLGGIAGKDGVLSVGDTATFTGSSADVVSLNGVSPELQSLVFSGSAGATLSASASEHVSLGKGVALAEVKALSGTNLIDAPVELFQDLEVTASKDASLRVWDAARGMGSGSHRNAAGGAVHGLDLAAGSTLPDLGAALAGGVSAPAPKASAAPVAGPAAAPAPVVDGGFAPKTTSSPFL
jgi:hypothetical protein